MSVGKWFKQIYWLYRQCLRQMEKRNHRWIAAAAFKRANIVLAEPGNFGRLLLR